MLTSVFICHKKTRLLYMFLIGFTLVLTSQTRLIFKIASPCNELPTNTPTLQNKITKKNDMKYKNIYIKTIQISWNYIR